MKSLVKGSDHKGGLMKKEWIPAFAKMSYGIYVLTTAHKESINGMIASWVSQISYDPPLVLVAVHPNRYTHELVEKSGVFALHIPAKHQKDLLGRFKGPDPAAKFAGIDWEKGKTGSPILKDCIAWMDCVVQTTYRPNGHTLFIGEIVEAHFLVEAAPLTTEDYEGAYLGKS